MTNHVAETELAFVDLANIGHAIYATSGKEPDPDGASQQIATKVRSLTARHPHAAICLDTPPYIRRAIDPTYKANRPERDAALHHQIDLAVEQLRADGYPVWGLAGFEADDIIASAVARALELDAEITVLVMSADKDLVQLVGPRVRVMSTVTGRILDETGVIERFGVKPSQMRDYLTLVGDAADNIKGAPHIGPKNAVELLTTHGTLDAILKAIAQSDASLRFKPAQLTNLLAFAPRASDVSSLIELSDKLPIPFEEIAAERTVPQLAPEPRLTMDEPAVEYAVNTTGLTPAEVAAIGPPPAVPGMRPSTVDAMEATGMLARVPEVVLAPWERQLDPRDRADAKALAIDMHASRLFLSNFGNAPAVLAAILMGRELGMSAIASLRGIHVIEGKPSLSAGLMVALVLRSGLAEYFEPVEMTETSATFVTKRRSGRKEITLTHTIEMAQQAGLVKLGSGWVKNPVDMLVARCQSRLARLVYPDLLAGLYSVEEVEEFSKAA